MAIANEKVSRDQFCACVMGCNQRPKPWRIPIASVTTIAPHNRTWKIESDLGAVLCVIKTF